MNIWGGEWLISKKGREETNYLKFYVPSSYVLIIFLSFKKTPFLPINRPSSLLSSMKVPGEESQEDVVSTCVPKVVILRKVMLYHGHIIV